MADEYGSSSGPEEALKVRLFPGVAFRGDDHHRRAWLVETGLDVWQIVDAYQDLGEHPDRVIAETDVTNRQLRIALMYYDRFPQEIDKLIASNRQLRPSDTP